MSSGGTKLDMFFRNVLEDQHVPGRGRYRNALVEDSANGLFYLYDSSGAYVQLTGNLQRVSVPPTASSPGVKGQIAWDTSRVYFCVATNTWRRASISSW